MRHKRVDFTFDQSYYRAMAARCLRLWMTALLLLAPAAFAPSDALARKRAAPVTGKNYRPVSIFGTSLRLGSVLEQLARNQGLHLIVRSDVNIKKEVDIPTLKNVALDVALKVILTPIGYSYVIDGQALIVFSRYVRVFRIKVPMIKQNWNAFVTNDSAVSNAGGSGEGGGSSSGESTLGARVSLGIQSASEGLWKELENTFSTLLSKGGTHSINRIAGLVTVNDTPDALDAVERYIDALNEEMSRQAVIEVRIAEVSIADRNQVGIDWNALWGNLGQMAIGTVASSGSALIKTPVDVGAVTFSFSGVPAQAVLTALGQQGEVNLISQPNLLVGNNLPALIQSGMIQTYVSSVKQVFVPNVGVQITVETSLLSNGLIMSILPRINDDNTITLAIAVVLQEVVRVDTRNFGESAVVELPTLNRRSYTGVVTTKMGESLVIAGLIDEKDSMTTRGVPILSKIPIIGVLFGSQDYEKISSELVIMITPRRVEPAAAGGGAGQPKMHIESKL